MKRYESKTWQDSMRIKMDYNYMMSDFIGNNGLTKEEVNKFTIISDKSFYEVQKNRGKGMMGWSELMYSQDSVVKQIVSTADEIREKCEYFVVLGIGGSALGPIAVFQALKHLHYNDLPKEKRNGPKFYVEDNIDPERMSALLDVIEPEKTIFNVITKSGATGETMSQYLVIYNLLKNKLNDKVKEHIIVTTSENSGNLIKIAKVEGYKSFYIPDGVGGRFSELCPVGLLPAAVLNIDIEELLAGAKYADEQCKTNCLANNIALTNAVLHYLSYRKGKNIVVMMPYSDSLKYMADWYCQLWAESLGKAIDKNGNTINVGQTPVKSLGVTDQHSQLQLYVEGPFDKIIAFIKVEKFRSVVNIPQGLPEFPDVNFLCGHTMNELINVEQFSSAYALASHNKMNYTFIMPEVNAFTIGQFMFILELATAYMGEMLEIDTFNQPGVEAGKQATYAMFERKGYEAKKKELVDAPKPKQEFIC